MLNLRKDSRFVKELEKANRSSSPADIEMLRKLDLMMKQIENIPKSTSNRINRSRRASATADYTKIG